jgi:hypothetical protein
MTADRGPNDPANPWGPVAHDPSSPLLHPVPGPVGEPDVEQARQWRLADRRARDALERLETERPAERRDRPACLGKPADASAGRP